MAAQSYGEMVEQAVLSTASAGGQPDFTYRPITVAKGGSVREVSDGLVWVGEDLIITSSKSRQPDLRADDTESRTRSWLDKNIARAARQAAGTWRTLQARSDLILRNERGIDVPWSAMRVDEERVFGVVIVDSAVPDGYISKVDTDIPIIVLTRPDWDFLHRTIYSASGVTNYIRQRASTTWRVPLGHEQDAFAAVVLAEAADKSPEQPSGGEWKHLLAHHGDLLFGERQDDHFGLVLDRILSGTADRDPAWSSTLDPHDYLQITTFLDRIPRLARVELGKRIMEKCRLAYEQGRHRYATFATPSGPLVFVSDPAERRDRVRYLQSITGLVHTKALDEGAEEDIQTLGVATEPFPNDGRSHDFCLMSGRFDLTDAARKTRDELWNATFTAPRTVDESVLIRLLD